MNAQQRALVGQPPEAVKQRRQEQMRETKSDLDLQITLKSYMQSAQVREQLEMERS